jgi:predicted permease
MATAANVKAGMSPDAAQRAAQLELGGVEQVKEAWRDQRGHPWLESLGQDLRYALRQLRRNPGFTAVATLSLGLAIGASTAIFSITSELLLQPLPVQRPEELVHLSWLPGAQGGTPRNYSGFGDVASFSVQAFESFRRAPSMLADLFAYTVVRGPNVRVDGSPEVAGAVYAVSGHYYQALGVDAALGRVLRDDDDRLDASPTVVLSHRYWQGRFGGDPAVIGKSLEINQVRATIIGVTPPGFVGPLFSLPADLTVPLAMAPLLVNDGRYGARPDQWWLRIGGRVEPGTTLAQAGASLEEIFRSSARDRLTRANDFPRLQVKPAGGGRSEEERQTVVANVLPRAAMAALLLLAACANVANLLLARGATRRREMDVRLALGATRRRLFVQLLVESVLLAGLGAALGTVLAYGGTDFLWLGQGEHFALDLGTLAFAAGLAVLVGVGFGVVPAMRAIGAHRIPCLGTRPTTQLRGRLSEALMTGQVAISFVLVVGGALFARSLYNLRTVEIGFDRSHLTLFSVDGFSAGHAVPDLEPLYSRIAASTARLPGVQSVTYSRVPLLSGFGNGRVNVSLSPVAGASNDSALINQVAPNFFETYGISIVLGRGFNERDLGAPVTVINQSFARHHFGEANPLGRNIYRNGAALEVIGVARDVKLYSLRVPTAPTFFTPSGPRLYGAAHFAVRTTEGRTLTHAALRQAVADVDSSLPVANVRLQGEEIERQLANDRVLVRLASFFGVVALVLAAVGLYGLAAYSTRCRTSEFGIRAALGALPRHLQAIVLRSSLRVAVAGTFLGVLAAVAAAQVLATRLYGLSTIDPVTYAAVAVLLLGTAMLAALLPARRAAKADPVLALRCE